MINTNTSVWKNNSLSHSLVISVPELNLTLGNNDIVAESLSLTESIETGECLSFIGCNASELTVSINNLEDNLIGQEIYVTLIAGTESISLFNGIVDSQNNLNKEDISTTITAYDKMYVMANTDVTNWYNNLVFPMSLSDFRNYFFAHIGILQKDTTLEFDSVQIEKTIDPEQLSGLDVITRICEINCVYGRISRSGLFEYIDLRNSATQVVTNYDYQNTTYEPYSVQAIDKVQIRADEDDIGAIAGSGTNAYVIEDNFLFYGVGSSTLEGYANRILNRINNITYIPMTLSCAGMPWLECGDKVSFSTQKNNIVSFVLERKLSGIQSLLDTLSAKGNQLRNEQINSVKTQITQLKGKANRLTRTIEETNSRIEDVEEGLSSQIRQTAEEIELQITNIYSELDGSINVYNTNEVPTLNNYPAWDFTYNIPCNNTVQTTDTLSFEYNDEFYRKNVRSIAYDLANSTTYRFKKTENTWGWVEVADTEYSLLMSRVTALEIKDGEIESSITSIYDDIGDLESEQTTLSSKITQTDDKITAEVSRSKGAESTLASSITQTATEIRAEVSNNYATKSSLNLTDDRISTEVSRAETVEKALASTITQTASSIRAEVSSGYATKASLELKVDKDDNGQIISMINASADRISLESGRLVINSGNFLLDANGTITATNGNFSGTITSSSGAIGGWDISGSGISKISESGHKVIFQSDGTLVCYKPNNGGVAWALTNNGGAQIPGYVTTSTLTANYITAGTISSTYATISNLDSAVARIGSLEATSITTSNLSAQISSLAAVYANSLWIGGKFVTSVDMSIGGRIRKVLVYEEQH